MTSRLITLCAVRSDQEFLELAKQAYYRNISDADAQQLLMLYPDDPAQGAPYGTGDDFQYTQMHKRAASFVGDAGVDSVRRFFTQQLSPRQDVWAYCESFRKYIAYRSKTRPFRIDYRRFYIDGFGSVSAAYPTALYALCEYSI